MKQHILTASEIGRYASPYLKGGNKSDIWDITSVEIDGIMLKAGIRMNSTYASPTDINGFHLSVFSALEIMSQLQILFMHHWAGLSEKSREVWMIDCNISAFTAIRDPDGIRAEMIFSSIRSIKGKVLAVMKGRIFDDQGAIEMTIKGFM